MKERILVPLNGTETGEAILPQLEHLILDGVRHEDSEVTLLHVLPVVNFNVLTTDDRAQLVYSEKDREEMSRNAYCYLEEVAVKLRRKGFHVTTQVKMGHPAEEIVKLANEISANLIAMATHGREGIFQWIKGSITSRVTNLENRIPVLTQNVGRERKENSFFSFHSVQSILKYI
jgi:nucleotide-binding universal stress UspA family protein